MIHPTGSANSGKIRYIPPGSKSEAESLPLVGLIRVETDEGPKYYKVVVEKAGDDITGTFHTHFLNRITEKASEILSQSTGATEEIEHATFTREKLLIGEQEHEIKQISEQLENDWVELFQKIQDAVGTSQGGAHVGLERPSVKKMVEELISKIDGALVGKIKKKNFEGDCQELLETLRILEIKAGQTIDPQDCTKILEAIDNLIARLNNIDTEKLQKKKEWLESYSEVMRKCIEVDSAVRDKRAQLSPEFNQARPQVMKGVGGKIRVIRKAPGTENLVISGGGGKGIGISPAFVELEKAGQFKDLNQIVGSSTGAVTGLLLAAGIKPKKMEQMADDNEFDDIKGDCKNQATKYPNVKLCHLGDTAMQLLELADRETAKSVKSYLDKNWDNLQFQAALANKNVDIERLQKLREEPDFNKDRSDYMITFKDLRMLHVLDRSTFKELTITAWDKENKEEFLFNADKTPDMPVALAGRISMSIPYMFKAVKIDPNKYGCERDTRGKRAFCDGGIGSNVPLEVFVPELEGQEKTEKEMEEVYPRTMVVAFESKGKVYKKMHDPEEGEGKGKFKDRIVGKLAYNPNYHETRKADDAKIRKMGPNVFVVSHGEIGTTDFEASQDTEGKGRIAKLLATKKALEQIALRRNQGMHQEFDDIEALYSALTPEETDAILAFPPSAGGSVNDLEEQLYNRVRGGQT